MWDRAAKANPKLGKRVEIRRKHTLLPTEKRLETRETPPKHPLLLAEKRLETRETPPKHTLLPTRRQILIAAKNRASANRFAHSRGRTREPQRRVDTVGE